MLSATVGISVQHIYCYCAGKTTFSLFNDATDACAADIAPAKRSCCKADKPSCCAKEAASGTDKHNCTKKSVKVFQLKTEFLVGHPLHKTFDLPIWADEFPGFLKLFRPVVCEAAFQNKAPPAPPPPLPGRVICLRHQLSRC